LLLALRERRRFLLSLAAALLAVGALFVWIDGATLVRALHNIDTRAFPTDFSAINLPEGLAHLLAPNAAPLLQAVDRRDPFADVGPVLPSRSRAERRGLRARTDVCECVLVSA